MLILLSSKNNVERFKLTDVSDINPLLERKESLKYIYIYRFIFSTRGNRRLAADRTAIITKITEIKALKIKFSLQLILIEI